MDFKILLLIIFLSLPFVTAVLCFLFQRSAGRVKISALVMSTARLLCIFTFTNILYGKSQVVEFSGEFLSEFGIRLSMNISLSTLIYLGVLELVFIFSYLVSPVEHRFRSVIYSLLMVCQGLICLLVLSTNLFILATLQILIALTLYFLVKFSTNVSGAEWNEDAAMGIGEKILLTYSLSATFLLLWSIYTKFIDGGLRPDHQAEALSIFLWCTGLIIALPLAPWSTWFNRAIEVLPESVSVIVVLFVSSVLYKQMIISSNLFLNSVEKYGRLFIVLGSISCFFSAFSLFAGNSKREILGYIPKFYVGLALICMGMYSRESFKSAFLLCFVMPIFTGLILYISALKIHGFKEHAFVGFFLAFLLGIPGTPLFQIFGIMVTRSVELGVRFTLAFGIIWFLYFVANVHICRRIFLDDTPAPSANSDLAVGGTKEMVFVLSMLIFIGLVVLIS